MSNEIFYSLSADRLVALTAYGEARTEGTEGMMAVINVIRNRTKEPSSFASQSILAFTKSVWHAVILNPYQFSPFNVNDPQRQNMESIASNFDSYVSSDSVLNQAYQLSRMLFMGTLSDNTAGATFFHAGYVSPSWASTIPFIGQIGNHLFYGYKTVATVITENPYVTTFVVLGIVLGAIIFLKKRR